MEGSIDAFMESLPQIEEAMQAQWKAADAKGERLKYVGSFDAKTGKASTGLTTVPADHPFFNIEGTDNIVLLTTDRYAERPHHPGRRCRCRRDRHGRVRRPDPHRRQPLTKPNNPA